MNLISFSIKSKGVHNFARRLWTVFTRFGFSEAATRRSLLAIVEATRRYGAAPTFFIPAVVLRRHSCLLAEISQGGVEIGIHGYVHNDYRFLDRKEQWRQTEQACMLFADAGIPFQGFRNPYLGWTEESVEVFAALGFTYDSNEAVLHDVIDLQTLAPRLRDGYIKSMTLFQTIACTEYTLRPHREDGLLRIPISVPDDEMLFDRLRITNQNQLGDIWIRVLQRVYDCGGAYVLNLHPERGLLCREALRTLLAMAAAQPLPVWIASLGDMAAWWEERCRFHLDITPFGPGRWHVEAICSPRATVLARYLEVEEQPTTSWHGDDMRLAGTSWIVRATSCPCIGLSPQTPGEVAEFLGEQGYQVRSAKEHETSLFALYLDLPEGLGTTRAERIERCSTMVRQIEHLAAPLVRFGPWPSGSRAALAITGDIDSVTVQDFFLRTLEVAVTSGTAAKAPGPAAQEVMTA